MTRLPGATAAILRRLLTLARDLLQAPDPRSVLELSGPAIQEILLADGALLLLALGDQEYITELDHGGVMQSVSEGTVLYRHARRAIDNQTPVLLPDVATDLKLPDGSLYAGGTVSLLAFPFPPAKPVGALAVFWYHRGRPRHFAKSIPVLRYIGELTTAALGNVGYRQMLEGRIAIRNR